MNAFVYEGVLPVHKPAGFTSHDTVAYVRRLLRERRIGHTGTLDPQVTGVLPLCVGKATRIVELLHELPKTYEAELTIGYATDTEDASGNVVEHVDKVNITLDQIKQTLERFVGDIEQVPPMYSAVKVGGKRLYELARQGVEVRRDSRKVTIHQLQLLGFITDNPNRPRIQIRVSCSKGTYIRTLCSDIGKSLGFPAVMTHLIRTESGGIGLASCVTLEELDRRASEDRLRELFIPIDQAIRHLPEIELEDSDAIRASQGQTLVLPEHILISDRRDIESVAPFHVRVYRHNRHFIGIYSYHPAGKLLSPVKVFAQNQHTDQD